MLPVDKPLWLLIRNNKAKTQVNISKISIGDKIKLGEHILKVLEIQVHNQVKDNLLPTTYVNLKAPLGKASCSGRSTKYLLFKCIFSV